MKKLFKQYSTETILLFVALLFVALTSAEMLSPMNITAIFLQNSYTFILVVGMTICMTVKDNIDISIGSFVCFICSMGGVLMSVFKFGTALTILSLLILGILWGILAGYIIAYCKIPAWVTTLGGYLAFRGLGVALINHFSDTGSIVGLNDSFLRLFSGKVFQTSIGDFSWGAFLLCLLLATLVLLYRILSNKREKKAAGKSELITGLVLYLAALVIGSAFASTGGIPVSFLWVFLLVSLTALWLDKTSEARKLIMIGSNPENARMAGINTKRAILMTYVFMALCATLAACIVLARYHASSSYAGINFEMDTIAACVIGGVSLKGGKQSILKAVLGATLIGITNLGLSLLGVDMNWQWIMKGFIILLAVGLDSYLNKKE